MAIVQPVILTAKEGSDDDDGTDFRGQKRSNDTHQSTTDRDHRFSGTSLCRQASHRCDYFRIADPPRMNPGSKIGWPW
jgi:hypothetical protein